MFRYPSLLLILLLLSQAQPLRSAEILWTQYCQHLDEMKLLVHLDADPTEPTSETVTLWLKNEDTWRKFETQQMFTLTSTALFNMKSWPRHKEIGYRVTSGASEIEGIFRAEPEEGSPLRLMGVSCLKDKGWPWKEAIAQMVAEDPDLVFFSGDQIYENDYDSPVYVAATSMDVAKGMKNYREKFNQFGRAFRDLMKDRPSIMITDDHDVFANDLWGKGGKTMTGDRTTGGYRCHPNWVNAVELTQAGTLPKPANKGPHGDGIFAFYTSVEYGGVKFAVIEDRKFKSPPSEVISQPILPPDYRPKGKKEPALEVVEDSTFDCTQLDRPDLHLLGSEQEAFLTKWSADLKKSGKLGAVLSSSPWAHCAMYSPTSADLDSNGWPQSGRNRALKAIGSAPVVMIHGDVHLGTLLRHGRKQWNDGPISFSLPAFSSRASRVWSPPVPGTNRELDAPLYTGEFRDRFGNKITMLGAANGLNGYGMITFDQENREVTLDFRPMNEDREPIEQEVAGWPHTVKFDKE